MYLWRRLHECLLEFAKTKNFDIPYLDSADQKNPSKINEETVRCKKCMPGGVKLKHFKIRHLPSNLAADYMTNPKASASTTPSSLRIHSKFYYTINKDTPIHYKHEKAIPWNLIETSVSVQT